MRAGPSTEEPCWRLDRLAERIFNTEKREEGTQDTEKVFWRFARTLVLPRVLPGWLDQLGALPGYHLPLAAAIGIDVDEADAERVRGAARFDADGGDAGQHHGVAEVLRDDFGRLDRGIDGGAGFHGPDERFLG